MDLKLLDSYKEALEDKSKAILKPNLGYNIPNLKIGNDRLLFIIFLIFSVTFPRKDYEILGDSLQVVVIIEQ